MNEAEPTTLCYNGERREDGRRGRGWLGDRGSRRGRGGFRGGKGGAFLASESS